MKPKEWYQIHEIKNNGKIELDRYYSQEGWSKFYQEKYNPQSHKAELEEKYPFKSFAIIKVTQTMEVIKDE